MHSLTAIPLLDLPRTCSSRMEATTVPDLAFAASAGLLSSFGHFVHEISSTAEHLFLNLKR